MSIKELDILRDRDWMVAVHNDYRQNGKTYTFWLMVKGETAIKGEGETDSEALKQILKRVDEMYTLGKR